MYKSRPIFLTLFLQYILIIIIFTIVIITISYNIIEKNYLDTVKEEIISNSYLVRELIQDDFVKSEYSKIIEKSNNAGQVIDKRITIIDKAGKIIADTREDPRYMDNHKDRPEVIEAFTGKVGISTRFSKTIKLKLLYVAIPVEDADKIIGVIRLSYPVKNINQIITDYKNRFFLLALILVIVALVFSFLISIRFIHPIRKITEVSKQVAEGNFEVRVFFRKKYSNEIDLLKSNFNEMTAKLAELFEKLVFEKEEVNSIITSIKEGIIVINNEGKIIRANQSFQKLFNIENAMNNYYSDIIREGKVIDFIDKNSTKAINSEKRFVEEIESYNKTILCSLTSLVMKSGFIVLFQDITELKKIETIKKDFISNVSHELRTPLTAIKGFTETLLTEENDPVKTKYLKIIQRHNERLINIVKDLLILSQLEKKSDDKAIKQEFEKLDLTAVVKNVMDLFENKINDKGLKLEYNQNADNINIKGDSFKLEQMLINLIDNAIKYTDHGSISVKLKNEADKIVVIIKDTGIGIAEKDQQRIFERFYVVDKSRSKKSGGTGLGLSIVKHVILLHKGKIKVKSFPGKGTRVKVYLPYDRTE